jgi:hypothetical protein
VFGGIDRNKEALDDLAVLQCDQEAWFAPEKAAVGPAARAFHAAAVVGSRMYLFGGHVYVKQQHKLHQVGAGWVGRLAARYAPNFVSLPGRRPALRGRGRSTCMKREPAERLGVPARRRRALAPDPSRLLALPAQFNDLWCLNTVGNNGEEWGIVLGPGSGWQRGDIPPCRSEPVDTLCAADRLAGWCVACMLRVGRSLCPAGFQPAALHPLQDTWEWSRLSGEAPDAPQPCPRDRAAMAPVGGGRLLVVGGADALNRRLDDAWLFDTEK